MLELEETLHSLNPSGVPSNVNRFLRTEFIIQMFGECELCIACLLLYPNRLPRASWILKCGHSSPTLEDFEDFYNFLDPRRTVTKMVFRTYPEKLRRSPMASFSILGNRDTRLMPLSQG